MDGRECISYGDYVKAESVLRAQRDAIFHRNYNDLYEPTMWLQLCLQETGRRDKIPDMLDETLAHCVSVLVRTCIEIERITELCSGKDWSAFPSGWARMGTFEYISQTAYDLAAMADAGESRLDGERADPFAAVLPVDIVQRIFGYVDRNKWVDAALVCKSWLATVRMQARLYPRIRGWGDASGWPLRLLDHFQIHKEQTAAFENAWQSSQPIRKLELWGGMWLAELERSLHGNSPFAGLQKLMLRFLPDADDCLDDVIMRLPALKDFTLSLDCLSDTHLPEKMADVYFAPLDHFCFFHRNYKDCDPRLTNNVLNHIVLNGVKSLDIYSGGVSAAMLQTVLLRSNPVKLKLRDMNLNGRMLMHVLNAAQVHPVELELCDVGEHVRRADDDDDDWMYVADVPHDWSAGTAFSRLECLRFHGAEAKLADPCESLRVLLDQTGGNFRELELRTDHEKWFTSSLFTITDLLRRCPRLDRLHIAMCEFDNRSCSMLAKALMANRISLRVLALGCSGVTDLGLRRLFPGDFAAPELELQLLGGKHSWQALAFLESRCYRVRVGRDSDLGVFNRR